MPTQRTQRANANITTTMERAVPEAWNTEIDRAVRTPWMLEALVAQDSTAAARFAHYYTALRRLPRRLRRATWGRRSLGLAGFAFILALAGPETVWGGTTISVSTGDELAEAITLANTQTGNYVGTNTIDVQAGLAVESPLDPITSPIVIEGGSFPIVASTSLEVPVFDIGDNGNLTLNHATVSGSFGLPSFLVGPGADLVLVETTVSGSTAGVGAAIYNVGTVRLTDCTLTQNTASLGGGALFNDGTAYLFNSTVSDNAAGYGGGIVNQESIVVRNSYVMGNIAGGKGGGIFNSGGHARIYDSTLSQNSAKYGGGISNTNSVTLSNSEISNNAVTENGGGIFNEEGRFDIIGGSAVDNNLAKRGGGLDIPSGMVTISHSTVSGNSSTSNGGGIRGEADTQVYLLYGTVSGNSSGKHGGGIYVDSHAAATIENSTVSGNTAYEKGGGIYLYHGGGGGRATIKYSTFTGNSAIENGGGMHTARGTTVEVQNSTFSGNGADSYGGGIKTDNEGSSDRADVMLTSSTVTGNSAERGGGIDTGNDVHLTLIDTLVSGNHANNEDNLYSVDAGNVTIALDNNNLFGYGGNSGVGGAASPGATDIIPSVDLDQILDTTLQNNGGPTYTHALVTGSPAIDAASTSCPPPDLDQRGYGRPAAGTTVCDIGAFEYGATDATAATIEVGGKIKKLGTDRGKYTLKAAFALEHELDLSDAVVLIEKLAAEGPHGEELIELEQPVKVAVNRARANKGVFKFDRPEVGKGKLKLKVNDGLLEAKLKLKRLELAEPTGCGEDGGTPVGSRFIVRSGVNPSVVIETNASWDCKFRKDGTVRKLER